MTAYKLGVYNLPAAEVVLVRTLMRLLPHDASFHWYFAETGPYDAVLTDATNVAGEVPSSLARRVLKITRDNASGNSDAITRPIRADRLQAWLARQGQELQGGLFPLVPVKSIVAAMQGATVRFKLRRWPHVALLQDDPHRIRLATLLSRRALGAHELSRISQLPLGTCQDFVDTLHQTGLIEVQRLDTTAGTRAVPAAQAVAGAAAGAAVQRPAAAGLINSIRRRLGV